jgi:geranylgeranyl diphosphate synthase type II
VSFNPQSEERIGTLRRRIDEELARLVDREEPERLYASVRYALEGRGKRIRPILTLLAADAHGCSFDDALPVAVSMEVFHTFTLVHDDIMDRSPLRRGRESVHVRWNEATAILCGDYLLGLSAQLLSRRPNPRLADMLKLHHETVQSLCEGQVMDMLFEERTDVSVDEYLEMIDRKTAALISCSLAMGGLIGNADAGELAALRDLGAHLGRAFQIRDDLLDMTASGERWGKPVGGDLAAGKKTFLTLKAVEASSADDRAFFRRILAERRADEREVELARDKMQSAGVLEAAEATVIFHSEKALESTRGLREGRARRSLEDLVRGLQNRMH